MLGRSLIVRAARVVQQQAKRQGHDHHVPANPGPPVTFDYMPIPHQPYQKVHQELQSKFNMYLGVSLSLLAASIAAAIYSDLWIIEKLRPPLSWRERNSK